MSKVKSEAFEKWAKARFTVLKGRIDVGVFDCDDMKEAWLAALAHAEGICRKEAGGYEGGDAIPALNACADALRREREEG